MDQALKARLIGAAVLVALAVLLIPELLTGQKPADTEDAAATVAPGTRTFTIELGGSSPDPTPTAKSVPGPTPEVVSDQAPAASGPGTAAGAAAGANPRTAPESASHPPAGGKPADQPSTPGAAAPSPAPPTPAPPPPSAASAEARAGAARSGWSVQVGAFSTLAKADKLAGELRSAGYRAYVSPVKTSGKTLQRVRVGPEANRSSAEGLAVKLKARGLPATVVASD